MVFVSSHSDFLFVGFFNPHQASAVGTYPTAPTFVLPSSGSATTSPTTFRGTCEVGSFVTISGFISPSASTTCSGAGTFSTLLASSTADGAQAVTSFATYSGWGTTTPTFNYGFGAYNFVANGYLYTAGGDDAIHFATPEETYLNRAPINGDGSLGSWSTAGVYDGFGQFFGGGIYLNGKIFLIAGVDPFYFERLSRIRSATLNVNTNTVGSWGTEANALPAPLWKFSLVQNGNYLYTIGGMDNSYLPTNVVYYTQVDTDGTMHAWQSTTPLPANRVGASSFVLNGKLYVLGGRSEEWSAVNTSSVFYATINNDGTLGVWTQSTDLPFTYNIFPTGNSMQIVNGYIYALGTGSDGTGTKYSQIQPDFSFGTWYDGPALIKPVESQTVESGGNLYALGTDQGDILGGPPDNQVQHMTTLQLQVAGNMSSSTALAFSIDNTIPTLVSSSINGRTLTLTYSKTLGTQTPATSAFAVLLGGVTQTVSSVQISGKSVVLTLSSTIPDTQSVTLSYTVPGSNPTQDTLAHLALALASITVLQAGPGSVINGGGSSSGSTTYIDGVLVTPHITVFTTTVTSTVVTAQSTSTPPVSNTTPTITPEVKPLYQFLNNLKYGDNGDDVLHLQTFLQFQSLLTTIPNGHFGPATRSALIKFQKINKIPATGFFGPVTRGVVNRML